ncbi:hypothetical protein [Clostridium cadaveris]|nr:hypothetical protein [Clostridium cadaveris]NWK11753.1 hypothetical protein [Clostridium cadaveris]
MKIREEIVNGKKRIIFVRHASGEDNVKEAIKIVLGEGFTVNAKNNK